VVYLVVCCVLYLSSRSGGSQTIGEFCSSPGLSVDGDGSHMPVPTLVLELATIRFNLAFSRTLVCLPNVKEGRKMDVEFRMIDRDSNWYHVPVLPPTSVFSSMTSIVSDHNIFCASCVISFLTFSHSLRQKQFPSFPQDHDQQKKTRNERFGAVFITDNLHRSSTSNPTQSSSPHLESKKEQSRFFFQSQPPILPEKKAVKLPGKINTGRECACVPASLQVQQATSLILSPA